MTTFRMLSGLKSRIPKIDSIRTLTQSSIRCDSEAPQALPKSHTGVNVIQPSEFQKRILVWVKRYPKGQVPDRVPADAMAHATTRARIRVCNLMILGSMIGFGTAIYLGKKDAEKHDFIDMVLEGRKTE